MITGLAWLALEVKQLDRAVEFYRDHLAVPTVRETDHEVAFDVGGSELVLRRPVGVPRGGLHTHYALAAAPGSYDAWHDRLAAAFDLHEHAFGDAHSLYVYDPAGNCVEIGESRAADDATIVNESATEDEPNAANDVGTEVERGSPPGLAGVFEVVLEIERLDRAVAFYTALGFELLDRGTDRNRVRLGVDGFALELWEPHCGIADARGGVHVDLGFWVTGPAALVATVEEHANEVTTLDTTDGRHRIRDPDGHVLTLQSA